MGLSDLFPVNSLFLCIGFVKTRDSCGFSRAVEKNSLLFSLLNRKIDLFLARRQKSVQVQSLAGAKSEEENEQ